MTILTLIHRLDHRCQDSFASKDYRHDALKRMVAQLHKDIQVTSEQGIDGYGPHGRVDLMVSIPPAGDVRPVDVGFTAAAQNIYFTICK